MKKNGHWETVVGKPAWDEPIYETVTDYKDVKYSIFFEDGYRTFSVQDAMQHGKQLTLVDKNGAYYTNTVREPVGSHKEHVGTKHHEAVTRQVWVED